MINPYQAPIEPPSSFPELEAPSAAFRLTKRQIRFAESKFLLYRCGGRLTLASFVMIALAVLVGFDPTMLVDSSLAERLAQIPLLLRELVVMAVATVVYLALIRRVRESVRRELLAHGVVDGDDVTVDVRDGGLCWTGDQGTFTVPLKQARLIGTGKGLIVVVSMDVFWFIPKRADFAGASYRDFIRSLARAA